MNGKLRLLGIATLVMAFFSAAIPASSVSAAPLSKCGSSYQIAICVQKQADTVRGLLSGVAYARTVTLKECNGYGHNCVVKAATQGYVTSWKHVAPGHVYQACVSFTDAAGHRHTNICSPFIAVPT
jgi:hypothetical protein